MGWTKQADEELKTLRAQGLSFSRIAEAINRKFEIGVSRNACIGRAARLALGNPEARPMAMGRAAAAIKREETKRIRRENGGLAPVRRYDVVVPERPKPPAMSATLTRTEPIPPGSAAFRALHAIKKGAPTQPDRRPMRCAEVDPLHVSILDLTDDCCRWPYGEQNFTFCGHRRIDGSSYCDAHDALSTAPRERAHFNFGHAA